MKIPSVVQKLRPFYWGGGFCLLVELHREGSAPSVCAFSLRSTLIYCSSSQNLSYYLSCDNEKGQIYPNMYFWDTLVQWYLIIRINLRLFMIKSTNAFPECALSFCRKHLFRKEPLCQPVTEQTWKKQTPWTPWWLIKKKDFPPNSPNYPQNLDPWTCKIEIAS